MVDIKAINSKFSPDANNEPQNDNNTSRLNQNGRNFRDELSSAEEGSPDMTPVNNQKLDESEKLKNKDINYSGMSNKPSEEEVGTEVASQKLVAQVYARMLNEIFEEMESESENEDKPAGESSLKGHMREEMINNMFKNNSSDPVVRSLNKRAGGVNGANNQQNNTSK